MKKQTTAQSRPSVFMHAARDGLSFGVLRRVFSGTNNVQEFGYRKLHPGRTDAPPLSSPRWNPDAARHDVILPGDAPDDFLNPAILLGAFEAAAHDQLGQPIAGIKDLALHIKIVCPAGQRLHRFWELGRQFAAEQLVATHGLPTLLILHHPPTYFSAASPHLHILVLSRPYAAVGWGRVTELAHDGAHEPLADAWKELCA